MQSPERRPQRRPLRSLPALVVACLSPWLTATAAALAQPGAGQPPGASDRILQGGDPALATLPATGSTPMSEAQPATRVGRPAMPGTPGASAATPPPDVILPTAIAPASNPTPPPGALPAGTIPPADSTAPTEPLISEAEFQQLLRTADLDRLNLLCTQLVAAGDDIRLRLLRERLLTIHPAPQPLPVVLANAEVMLTCRMPDGALTVLDRIGPARGAEQVKWLTLQWRAANAAMDHRRAALALERLVGGRPDRLEALLLPLQQRSDGSWASRSALDLLASHLESAGQGVEAAALLQISRSQDAAAAERLAQAARLLADLPAELREPLFERALEQAAAVGSWGLVGELLAAQASLPSNPETAARTAERRLRLSRRLDDAYGEWRALLQAAEPADEERRRVLQLQLRSPRAVGGHAEGLAEPASLLPPDSTGQGGQARSRSAASTVAAPAADLPGASDPPPRPEAIPPSGSPAASQP